jgi:DNA-binding response OmpR family regulator
MSGEREYIVGDIIEKANLATPPALSGYLNHRVTSLQFKVAFYMGSNANSIVPSTELAENIWRREFVDHQTTNINFVGDLVSKLLNKGFPIFTYLAKGYIWHHETRPPMRINGFTYIPDIGLIVGEDKKEFFTPTEHLLFDELILNVNRFVSYESLHQRFIDIFGGEVDNFALLKAAQKVFQEKFYKVSKFNNRMQVVTFANEGLLLRDKGIHVLPSSNPLRGLSFYSQLHMVTHNGKEDYLPGAYFKLLDYFFYQKDKIVPKRILVKLLYPNERYKLKMEQNVSKAISKLNQRLGKDLNGNNFIESEGQEGYILRNS